MHQFSCNFVVALEISEETQITDITKYAVSHLPVLLVLWIDALPCLTSKHEQVEVDLIHVTVISRCETLTIGST